MSQYRMPLAFVQESIKKGFSNSCHQIHDLSCNRFCFNYFFTTWQASYKTYAAAYAIQFILKFKAILKNPVEQIPKFITQYLKSTSLTAVQMMLMRKILCILANYSNSSPNLLIANLLSAIYILIQSPSRQIQIALYQVTNTSNILFNMLHRRKFIKSLPMGQCILFGCSIMIICYFIFNQSSNLRSNYVKSIFIKLIGQI